MWNMWHWLDVGKRESIFLRCHVAYGNVLFIWKVYWSLSPLSAVVYSQPDPLGQGFQGQLEQIKRPQKFSMSGVQSYNSVLAHHNVFTALWLRNLFSIVDGKRDLHPFLKHSEMSPIHSSVFFYSSFFRYYPREWLLCVLANGPISSHILNTQHWIQQQVVNSSFPCLCLNQFRNSVVISQVRL